MCCPDHGQLAIDSVDWANRDLQEELTAMPFTPLHMGPGLLIKALLQTSFSLMIFGWTQILMDLQPLIVMITGQGHLHGFSHTLIGALLIAALAVITGVGLCNRLLRGYGGAEQGLRIGWPVATLSALIGSGSHVLLDAIMHADLQPWAPMNVDNPLLGWISVTTLHRFCLYGGLAGALLYALVHRVRTGRLMPQGLLDTAQSREEEQR